MQAEHLQHMAKSLHARIQEARGSVGLYYDSTGVFRISPTVGVRFNQIVTSFPSSVVGIYTNKIDFDSFFEDFEYFCREMGVR